MSEVKDVKQQGMITKAKQERAVEEKKKPQTLKDYVVAMEGQIARALPKVITPERFTRIALTALSSNPRLAQCETTSFMGALMQAAQLGLEPNTPLGQAYIIPYHNRKKGIYEAQFQVGYKGLIDLAYRGGEMQSVYAHVVREGDTFEFEFGLDQKLVHVPAKRNRGDVTYVYAVFKLKNGGVGFDVMSADEVAVHAERYSKAYSTSDSPWRTNFDEMAKKTVLKRVLKYAPVRTEFLQASSVDGATLTATADDDFEIHAEYVTVDDVEVSGMIESKEDGEFTLEGGDSK